MADHTALLMRFRVELYAAAQLMKGEDLADFATLIGEIAMVLDIDRPARTELAALRAEVNSPHTTDFLDAVRSEAIHQRERWGTAHDQGKADEDWFWLLGYLGGKVLRADADDEKKLHRIIAAAAVLLNWHAHRSGADQRMRPGIAPPAEVAGG